LEENELMERIARNVLEPGEALLRRYREYEDCHELIVEAISAPTEDNIEAAFEAILPSIVFQAEILDFSGVLVNAFEGLSSYMIGLHQSMLQSLEASPCIARAFADLFNLVLAFDEQNMRVNSEVLGDLGFFRRNATRRLNTQNYDELYGKSWDMSIFFGTQSPFLNKIIAALQNKAFEFDLTSVLDLLAGICDGFTSTLTNHRFEEEDWNVLCYRAIAGSIICYDHLSQQGAFHSKAGLQTGDAVRVLSKAEGQGHLLKLLKFVSKHYSEPRTQRAITEIIK
jgi:hypothetical protein